jgi:hypothetical protein
VHLDLVVRRATTAVAIELKYLAATFAGTVEGERFEVPNRAAHDISRYDVVKGIVRLERLVADGYADRGIVLILTNDSSYWRPGVKVDPVDAAFRIHEGQHIAGACAWSTAAGPGTTRGREQPLTLTAIYRCTWHPYTTVVADGERRSELRYLAFDVHDEHTVLPVGSTAGQPSQPGTATGERPPDTASTAREEILLAVSDVLRRSGGIVFNIGDVVVEMRRRGSRYAESTIRTHITSRMCANASDHHARVFDDFERLDRGHYQLRRPPNS